MARRFASSIIFAQLAIAGLLVMQLFSTSVLAGPFALLVPVVAGVVGAVIAAGRHRNLQVPQLTAAADQGVVTGERLPTMMMGQRDLDAKAVEARRALFDYIKQNVGN